MTYNIQFQIAGFCIILVLNIMFFSKKRWASLQNRIFSVLLAETLVQLAFDFTSVCTIVHRDEIPGYNMFFSKGYLVAMLVFVWLIDIYAVSNTLYDDMPEWRKKTKMIFAGAITLAMLVTVIIAIAGELLFAGEGFYVYSYGSASDAVYIFSAISVGFVILILLLNCRHVPLKRQASIYSFCVMEGIVAIVQASNKELLIIGFGSALTVFIMYFTLENPDMDMIAALELSNEQAEKARMEAEEANQAKSIFLSNMSHELRTPINAVLGMNEMIRRESKEESTRGYAQQAYNAAKELLSLVNDLLDISNIEAGKGVSDDYIFTAKTARILVVDDVEMNLFVFENLLKGHKLTIDKAGSGAKCLELTKQNKYDVIFMDHMMPEMDGIETYRMMKNTEHLNKETPVIMLTANAITGEKEKCLAEGFVSYLTKPINIDALEEALFDYLPKEKIEWEERAADIMMQNADTQEIQLDSDLFDVNQGLSYAGDNKEAYRKILSSYVNSGSAKLDAIRDFCEKESWSDYVTAVHALKSTSLTVGATRLGETAKELEACGKAGEYETIREKTGGMLELYAKVIDEGRLYLERLAAAAGEGAGTGADGEGAAEAGTSLISKEELLKIIDRIIEAAQGFDQDEILAACDEAKAYCYDDKPLDEILSDIRTLAEGFECDAAGDKAREIKEGVQ